ncbi:MAG: histidine kinase [Bacteroidota bacterium]
MRSICNLFLVFLSFYVLSQGTYDSLIALAEKQERNDPDSVFYFAHQAYKYNPELPDAYFWIGNSWRYRGNLDSALHWSSLYQQMVQDSLQLGNAHMSIGAIHYASRKYLEAFDSYTQAATIFQTIDQKDRESAAYANLSIVVGLAGQFQKAISYNKNSIDLSAQLGDSSKALPAIINLAAIYLHLEQYDSSLILAWQAYNIADGNAMAYAKARACQVLGPTLVRAGQLEQGYAIILEGKQLFESLGAEISVVDVRRLEAEALLIMGKATDALRLGRSLLKNSLSQKDQLYELLSEIHQKLEDADSALFYHKRYHFAYVEEEEGRKSEQIAQLEASYQAIKRQNEILELSSLLNTQRQENEAKIRIASIIGLLLLSSILIVVFYYRQKVAKAREKEAVRKQQLLRSQINPHFIFNSLATIRGFLFDNGEVKQAVKYLGHFSKLMRLVLDLSSREWVSLEEELEALELYIAIQQIRFNRSFTYSLKIDPAIDTGAFNVPPLLAQPFVENAIEHGLKGIRQSGEIILDCKLKGDKLAFEIRDNGIGISEVQERPDHRSKAIQIFKDRISLLSKRMKMSLAFEMIDLSQEHDNHGTSVRYELPLILK